MDATVDDFLKEINELVPPKPKIVWKECFDENSGFPYYWNVETDEVTWETPKEYKKHSGSKSNPKRLFIPPPSKQKPKIGPLPVVDGSNVKIYKIDAKSEQDKVKVIRRTENQKILKANGGSKRNIDEKKALISYGSSSESENEGVEEKIVDETTNGQTFGPDLPPKTFLKPTSKDPSPDQSDDESAILSELQKKATVLKQLGGEVPAEVQKLVNTQEVNAFSLVAGYGDDSDECEDDPKTIFPLPEAKEPASTLFPAAAQIDVKQFCEVEPAPKPKMEETLDVKAFQRKRRIGISLVNTQKRKAEEKVEGPERAGFGFGKVEYPGFKSGGVLHGTIESKGEENVEDVPDFGHKDDRLAKEVVEIQSSLGEKLKFLSEVHSPAPPVQVMIIQMETLYTAMKEGCLKPSYLKRWLESTLGDLTKLEKEAAPAGWLLQWDRVHKRYYYHNETSGESQWEYPQPDIVSGEDAMDICTTPPHPSCDEHSNDSIGLMVPPPPPIITEPRVTPPPPPIISKTISRAIDQPLPPGVEDQDFDKPKPEEKEVKQNSSFSLELNSFYSDIAAIESIVPVPQAKQEVEPLLTFTSSLDLIENQPAKKKKKVKVSSGLAMKKKGVSKLVEKWKNVQKNYD